jgi:dihydropyrimidinase/allantoinase
VLISEGYHKRGLPLTRIAELASAAPSQAYNLYGTKGTIAVGADADLAIVDLDLTQVVTPELCQSAQDHTPFEGIAVRGWPTTTVLRGQRVMTDGVVTDGFAGQYVRR